MNKFRRLCIVDKTGLNEQAIERLRGLSDALDCYDDYPTDQEEIARRIGDADCVVVSYNTVIGEQALAACPNVRYIGMACSYYGAKSANVPVEAALARGIVIKGVSGYSDIGPVEFLVCALLSALHGFYGPMYGERPRELVGLPIGVIGVGATGKIAVRYLTALGADVYYNDMRRSEEVEAMGATYLALDELLQKVICITTHIPRNISLINRREFELFGNGKIYVNTAVGPTFDVDDMLAWLAADPKNLYLCDEVGMGGCEAAFRGVANCVYTPKAAGSSIQCTIRLSDGVVQHAKDFLEGK